MRKFDENFFADAGRAAGAAGGRRFDLLLRSPRTQVVLATLPPGHTSQPRPSVHRESEQVVYLIEGEAQAVVDGREYVLNDGQLLLIAPGQKFQFTNTGTRKLMYLNYFASNNREEAA